MRLIRITIATHSAPIRRQGAHSDGNCVPFSTHRGVRKPVVDVPKIMARTKRLFSRVLTSQKLGRQTSEKAGIYVCVLLRFRRSRGNNNSRHVSRLPPCPALLGFFAATQRGTNGRMLVGNQGPGAGGRLLGVQRSGLALKRPCEQGVPMGLLSGQVKKGHSRGGA